MLGGGELGVEVVDGLAEARDFAVLGFFVADGLGQVSAEQVQFGVEVVDAGLLLAQDVVLLLDAVFLLCQLLRTGLRLS